MRDKQTTMAITRAGYSQPFMYRVVQKVSDGLAYYYLTDFGLLFGPACVAYARNDWPVS